MTRITIEENGRETVVTDVAPYRAERDRIVATLKTIFTGFEKGTVGALDAREAEIVVLVNRHNFLSYVIDMFDEAIVRRANILAGWEIVKTAREGAV